MVLLGCDVGRHLVRLWGSERDILEKTQSRKARFFNLVNQHHLAHAFCMSPERMRQYIAHFNEKPGPCLILAYAQAAYELARFAERKRSRLDRNGRCSRPAGTLYPFMREKISRVFGCEVYNLYGSREVSIVGCELPGLKRVMGAAVGETSWKSSMRKVCRASRLKKETSCDGLTNYAMPLVRYWIGDRGALVPDSFNRGGVGAQVLKYVSGRNVDVFRTRDRTLVDGEYFTHLLVLPVLVWKFQVVQKAPEHVQFRIIKTGADPAPSELAEITAKSRLVMGPDCRVEFEFPQSLPPAGFGKIPLHNFRSYGLTGGARLPPSPGHWEEEFVCISIGPVSCFAERSGMIASRTSARWTGLFTISVRGRFLELVWKHFYTSLIDLSQSPTRLLGRMSKSTAYKIRRARDKERITCECCDTNQAGVLDEFEQIYNRFAAQKKPDPAGPDGIG